MFKKFELFYLKALKISQTLLIYRQFVSSETRSFYAGLKHQESWLPLDIIQTALHMAFPNLSPHNLKKKFLIRGKSNFQFFKNSNWF